MPNDERPLAGSPPSFQKSTLKSGPVIQPHSTSHLQAFSRHFQVLPTYSSLEYDVYFFYRA